MLLEIVLPLYLEYQEFYQVFKLLEQVLVLLPKYPKVSFKMNMKINCNKLNKKQKKNSKINKTNV